MQPKFVSHLKLVWHPMLIMSLLVLGIFHNGTMIYRPVGWRFSECQIEQILDLAVKRYPYGWGEYVPIFFCYCIHLLLLCGGTLPEGRGCAMISLLLWEWTRKEINFLVSEMFLLKFLIVVKELVVGGATSDILYNILPKEIMIERGLNSYIIWCIHKYGYPNNTSQTSSGATSHDTSCVKGFML